MATVAQSFSVLMVLSAAPLAGLAIYAARQWEKPGARGFFLCQVGAVGWSLMLAMLAWPTLSPPIHLHTAVRFAFQFLVALGWALLVFEYTRGEETRLWRPVVAALLVVPVLSILLAATNPSHHLVLDPATPAAPAGISELVLGPWYFLFLVFAIACVVLPVGPLLTTLQSAHGVHRRQILLLLGGLAIGVPGALNSFAIGSLGLPAYVDLTPTAFLAAGVLWGVALFRYQLFSLVPVSRRTTVEMMSEPVIAVDASRTVIDANPAARDLFDVDGLIVGAPLAEFADAHPQLLDAFDSNPNQDVELTLTHAGEERHFLLNVHPVALSGTDTGSVLVLREVTQLREREHELDLFKQILSRVFRHDMRNALNVVQGHTEEIQARDETGAFAESTAAIQMMTDRLLGLSEKASDLGAVIDADGGLSSVDLDAAVTSEVESFQRRHPDVAVTTMIQANVQVQCHTSFDRAVRELLENAVAHFDGDPSDLDITVRTRREGGQGVFEIFDNGPGIGAFEIEAMNAGRETPLEHASGVGLWMVHLIVWKSRGRLQIDGERPTSDAVVDAHHEDDGGGNDRDTEPTRDTRISISLPTVAEDDA